MPIVFATCERELSEEEVAIISLTIKAAYIRHPTNLNTHPDGTNIYIGAAHGKLEDVKCLNENVLKSMGVAVVVCEYRTEPYQEMKFFGTKRFEPEAEKLASIAMAWRAIGMVAAQNSSIEVLKHFVSMMETNKKPT